MSNEQEKTFEEKIYTPNNAMYDEMPIGMVMFKPSDSKAFKDKDGFGIQRTSTPAVDVNGRRNYGERDRFTYNVLTRGPDGKLIAYTQDGKLDAYCQFTSASHEGACPRSAFTIVNPLDESGEPIYSLYPSKDEAGEPCEKVMVDYKEFYVLSKSPGKMQLFPVKEDSVSLFNESRSYKNNNNYVTSLQRKANEETFKKFDISVQDNIVTTVRDANIEIDGSCVASGGEFPIVGEKYDERQKNIIVKALLLELGKETKQYSSATIEKGMGEVTADLPAWKDNKEQLTKEEFVTDSLFEILSNRVIDSNSFSKILKELGDTKFCSIKRKKAVSMGDVLSMEGNFLDNLKIEAEAPYIYTFDAEQRNTIAEVLFDELYDGRITKEVFNERIRELTNKDTPKQEYELFRGVLQELAEEFDMDNKAEMYEKTMFDKAEEEKVAGKKEFDDMTRDLI